jgi:hypothetical protein
LEDTVTRCVVIILVAVICTLVVARARADARIVVHDFHGPSADRLRDDVVNLLERQSSVTLISQGQLETSARKLGVDPLSPEGRVALARELQLSAWLAGVVKRQEGALKLTIVVYGGAQHSLMGRTSLSASTASKLGGEIREHLWRKSRRAILQASAPAPGSSHADSDAAAARAAAASSALSSPASSEPSVKDSFEDTTLRPGRGDSLRAFIGVGSTYRSLAFSDAITTSLGDYQLSGAPLVDINVAFYPARPFTDAWISWLGLDVRAQIAATTPTVDRDGNQFKSRYAAYHVGVRARAPVGRHYVSAFSGYAVNGFEIAPEATNLRSPTPSIDYSMIRSGLSADFTLSDSFMLGLDGAWLHLLSVGEIGEWFPRASAGGLELAMFATYNLTQRVFARASAAYQRTFFSFNPQPGDPNVAGGATDQYLAVSVGAGVIL